MIIAMHGDSGIEVTDPRQAITFVAYMETGIHEGQYVVEDMDEYQLTPIALS